jgi:hypothetical protein
MQSALARFFSLALLAMCLAPPPVLAEEEAWPAPSTKPSGPPKPLLAVPSGTAAPAPDDQSKLDRSGVPKYLADARAKLRNEFTGWLKDSKAIQAECDAAHTPVERQQCDLKKNTSQKLLDDIHLRTRQVLRQIDVWRRKQAGLPPPEWWPPENQPLQKDTTTAPPSPWSQKAPAPQKDNSTLLPNNSAPLPANTF